MGKLPSDKYRTFRDRADLQAGDAEIQDAQARSYRRAQQEAAQKGFSAAAREHGVNAATAESNAARHRRRSADLLRKAQQIGPYPLED